MRHSNGMTTYKVIICVGSDAHAYHDGRVYLLKKVTLLLC